MSGLTHICRQLGYSSREIAALAWIDDTPVIKHALEFIASKFIVLSNHEASLLEEAPQSIRDLSEEALDQKIAELEQELLTLQQQRSDLSDSIQSAIPHLKELAGDLEQVIVPEKLPDLAAEVEKLQITLRQNTVSILGLPEDLKAQLNYLRQFFIEENNEECNLQVLETFIKKEDWFMQIISAAANEIRKNVDSTQSHVEQYSAECSAAINCHKTSMNAVMHKRLTHLLCTSRLKKLTEILPLYAAGKYLPQFPAALKEFVSVHKQYKELLDSCSKLADTVICCSEAISQQMLAEALLQRCSDVKGQALDLLLETISDAISRGEQGVSHATERNRTISAVMNASNELLETLSRLQNDHISPTVAASKLVTKAKEELVISPVSALGYQSIVSALSGSTVRGAAQVADSLLFVSKADRTNWSSKAVDLSDVLNLQDKSISAIDSRTGEHTQTTTLNRLRQAILELKETLEQYSDDLGQRLRVCD